MLDVINQWIAQANDFLYGYILIALLVISGVYFTIRTKFVQIRLFPEAIRVLTEKKKEKTGVSSFQALMISTASRVGTGNIAGVATALSMGGAGAIFWMWVMAIVGSASAFVESTLAQVYKERDGEVFRGGPAYYIQYALGQRWLGIIFSILLIACFAFGFNALQSFNVSSAFEYYVEDYANSSVPMIIGLILAAATALVIFGGVQRIGIITSGIVPVMALLYIVLGLYITCTNLGKLPDIFGEIFAGAFDFKSIAGGFAGSCVMYGIKRGLFSNEAGMGSAPNAGATADVSHPAKQGMVQMLSVFIDTILICTTTAMMLLNFGTGNQELTGMPYVQQAVNAEVGVWGIHFITVSIFLFAFSSLIGNYCYAESNLKFIKDSKGLLFVFRIIVVGVVFVGAQANFDTVWNLADVLMGLMAIVNIGSILLLSRISMKVMNDYTRQKKEGKDPQFHPDKLGIKNTQCWK
ncbi:amino acid carrier protein [Lactonifactor sp. BIOML-A3]|uniref:alanine/glycine:cation symporter family protein n=1 Tax=unclassified Lactonifactor TaxID=2636670 RepID=UPI0012B160EA|nr:MULTISPECIES: alanine/glycine:cation symporter family protein [unclassified Lactonifactor]MSA01952.1 amino acid carrier protein [Lactonifactor sp. BIOML-A5]MSA08466.1 amino acid carrier protein [Lactonifactor sp. BIOML-A4]MSA12965.1 amino acid carrier protein [Lactonifactor sp. BIOML-A3]MSA17533.1 amino acid carrier protein [Lactonifactor sp. BIOML-A2]MSA37065.1 amino acid carrier protein [Lactonifactor sp. BIOML-A1]